MTRQSPAANRAPAQPGRRVTLPAAVRVLAEKMFARGDKIM